MAALAAASALNIPYGTIYAFSVFLRPMEQQLGVSRTEMSVVFAMATVVLAVGMNLLAPLARQRMCLTARAMLATLGRVGSAQGVPLATPTPARRLRAL